MHLALRQAAGRPIDPFQARDVALVALRVDVLPVGDHVEPVRHAGLRRQPGDARDTERRCDEVDAVVARVRAQIVDDRRWHVVEVRICLGDGNQVDEGPEELAFLLQVGRRRRRRRRRVGGVGARAADPDEEVLGMVRVGTHEHGLLSQTAEDPRERARREVEGPFLPHGRPAALLPEHVEPDAGEHSDTEAREDDEPRRAAEPASGREVVVEPVERGRRPEREEPGHDGNGPEEHHDAPVTPRERRDGDREQGGETDVSVDPETLALARDDEPAEQACRRRLPERRIGLRHAERAERARAPPR